MLVKPLVVKHMFETDDVTHKSGSLNIYLIISFYKIEDLNLNIVVISLIHPLIILGSNSRLQIFCVSFNVLSIIIRNLKKKYFSYFIKK